MVGLTRPQRMRLYQALADSFDTEARLNMLVNFAIGKNLDQVSRPGNLDERIVELIQRADAERWLGALLRAAVAERKENGEFQQLFDELQTRISPEGIDHYNVHWMNSRRVLVDRSQLRRAVRKLREEVGIRILVVHGPRSSGKTYSWEFISYLQSQLGTFEGFRIDLTRLAIGVDPPAVQVEDLAQSLANRLDLEAPPARDKEQTARWILRFCEQLERKLTGIPGVQWIVLDGFNNVGIPPETGDLVTQIALEVADNLPNVRLVLLSYRGDELPTDLVGRVEEEEISLKVEQIDLELEKVFNRLYEERKRLRQVEYSHEEIQKAVDSALEEMDRDHPRRLNSLSAAVMKVAHDYALVESNGS